MQRILSVILLASSAMLVACGPQTPAAAAKAAVETPAELARLVPADVISFVRLASIDACESFLRRITRPFDEDEADDYDMEERLRRTGLPGDLSHLDRTRPLGIAVTVDADTREPALSFIVPVADRQAYEASVGGFTTAADGDYVGVSKVSGYAGGSQPHQLATHLPDGAIAMRVDLEGLLAVYRSQIDLVVAGAFNLTRASTRGNAAQAAQMDELLGLYEEWLAAVLDSAERLDVGLSMDGTALELDAEFWAIGGSPLGTLGSAEPTGIADLADTVSGDGQIVLLLGMDMGAMGERLERFTTRFVQLVPEPMQAWMSESMTGWDEVYAASGSAFAASMSLGPDGMRMTQVLQPTDTDALFEVYRQMYGGEAIAESGLILEPLQETTRNGARVLSLRMDVLEMAMQSAEGMAFPPADASQAEDTNVTMLPGETGDDALAPVRAMMERLYGSGGTDVRVASKGGRLAVLMGGDEVWARRAMADMGGGVPVSDDLGRELDRVERLNPCLAAEIDLGRLIEEWMDAMRPALGRDLPDTGPLPTSRMTFSLGVAGRTWKGHAVVELDALGAVFRQLADS